MPNGKGSDMRKLSSIWRDARYSLGEVYNLKDDKAKGRLISLLFSLVAAIFNVFITGSLYTGFLTMNDIDIAGVGIISFIPCLASVTSVFSSLILERIKHQKAVLIASELYFYVMYILATTIMPVFVKDPSARVVWLAVILFLAYGVNALFSPGLTTWFYNFYPDGNELRIKYMSLNSIFSSIMSSIVLMGSGLLADAVAGSANQYKLIVTLRYVAFGLVLVSTWLRTQAKYYPYPVGEKTKLSQVFTLPFRYRKFILCMGLLFFWGFISNLNSGTWTYHLLNHIGCSYTIINFSTVMYTVFLILFTPFWRRVLRRHSWIRTFAVTCLMWVPTEILFFCMTQETSWMYVPLCVAQNLISVGMNLSYANIIYMNLPKENSTTCIAFYTVGYNLCASIGAIVGTKISSLGNDMPSMFLGINAYSVQYTTLLRAVFIGTVGAVLLRCWRAFSRDEDIAEVEKQDREKAPLLG